MSTAARRSVVHWARLTVVDGVLHCDRNRRHTDLGDNHARTDTADGVEQLERLRHHHQ